jgi:hypothetical protein
MIVGGYAVAYHGFPRFTRDIDIYYEMRLDNILLCFGFVTLIMLSVLYNSLSYKKITNPL